MKLKLPLYLKIILGMVLGVLFGLLAVNLGLDKFTNDWVKPWGEIFLRLLKMVAVPLVFVSLVKGIGGLSNIQQLSRIGFKTLGFYVLSTIVAISIGVFFVNTITPGDSFPKEKSQELLYKYSQNVAEKESLASNVADDTPMQVVVDMIPDNVFAACTDNSKMLQIIFFAIFFGIAMVSIKDDKIKYVKGFIDGFNDIILKIIDYIMMAAPYGVFALMAGLLVDYAGDMQLFVSLGLYAITVILGLASMIFIVYPLIIHLFTPINYKDFIRTMLPVQMLAFSTSSSAATLPLNLKQVSEGLKVPADISNFVLPVGVTINMDGTSCYQAIAAIFIAQVFDIDLTVMETLTIILTATISSIGTPGIPGGSIVMLIVVLTSVGIPIEGIALILGIDRPLDMLRTVVNVTGDATVASIVATSEKQL
jgi:Na+/H+-dicarboxylate symporter